jgi:hypothetical protein
MVQSKAPRDPAFTKLTIHARNEYRCVVCVAPVVSKITTLPRSGSVVLITYATFCFMTNRIVAVIAIVQTDGATRGMCTEVSGIGSPASGVYFPHRKLRTRSEVDERGVGGYYFTFVVPGPQHKEKQFNSTSS